MGMTFFRSIPLSEHKDFVLNNPAIIKPLLYCGLASVIILSSFKETGTSEEIPAKPYAEIETAIRSKYDSYAIFKWDQYAELLGTLSQDKFIVLPLNEMRRTFDDSKVVMGLRHDVDLNPFKALEMAKLEKMYGIRATYFLLATAEYYGKIDNSRLVRSRGIEDIIKEIHNTGAEIGIHNDLITIMVEYGLNPYSFNKAELAFYRSLKIKINGTASHGSAVAKKQCLIIRYFLILQKVILSNTRERCIHQGAIV
jgi:hypothetical protein